MTTEITDRLTKCYITMIVKLYIISTRRLLKQIHVDFERFSDNEMRESNFVDLKSARRVYDTD